jgi:hypothetical protein
MLIKTNFIKELVCLVHNVNLFDYKFLDITRPDGYDDYLVILEYSIPTETKQYTVYQLPFQLYELALHSTDGGEAAMKVAKELGRVNKIKWYKGLLNDATIKSDYYLKQIGKLRKDSGKLKDG